VYGLRATPCGGWNRGSGPAVFWSARVLPTCGAALGAECGNGQGLSITAKDSKPLGGGHVTS